MCQIFLRRKKYTCTYKNQAKEYKRPSSCVYSLQYVPTRSVMRMKLWKLMWDTPSWFMHSYSFSLKLNTNIDQNINSQLRGLIKCEWKCHLNNRINAYVQQALFTFQRVRGRDDAELVRIDDVVSKISTSSSRNTEEFCQISLISLFPVYLDPI